MALLTSFSTVLFVILNFRRQHTKRYWASISECGAANGNYGVYSRGMTVSAVLLGCGTILFITNVIMTVKSYGEKVGFLLPFVASALTIVMCVSMAYQGIVKIDLTTDSDPHRTGAGIFFLSAMVNCWLYSSLFNKAWKPSVLRRGMRYAVLALVAGNIYLNKVVIEEFNINMSVTQRIQSKEDVIISKFSFLQYALIATLLMGLGSIVKFK